MYTTTLYGVTISCMKHKGIPLQCLHLLFQITFAIMGLHNCCVCMCVDVEVTCGEFEEGTLFLYNTAFFA